jgi:hypothetical protein
VGLERGPLSPCEDKEELLERKVAVPVYKTEINDRRGSAALTTRHTSIHKSWHYISSTSGGRSVGIVRLRTKGHGVCLFCYRYRYIVTGVDRARAIYARYSDITTLYETRRSEQLKKHCKTGRGGL